MKFITTFGGILLAAISSTASAATFTYGDLISDDATDIIYDTRLDREYTRLDAYSLPYADVIASTQTGGAYEGWQAMTSATADEFLMSLFSSLNTPCDGAVSNTTVCGGLDNWQDGHFGNNDNQDADWVSYINTTGGTDIGSIRILANGTVQKFENNLAITSLDRLPISLTLYRDAPAPIPLPASGVLLLAGLSGLAFARRSKKDPFEALT